MNGLRDFKAGVDGIPTSSSAYAKERTIVNTIPSDEVSPSGSVVSMRELVQSAMECPAENVAPEVIEV